VVKGYSFTSSCLNEVKLSSLGCVRLTAGEVLRYVSNTYRTGLDVLFPMQLVPRITWSVALKLYRLKYLGSCIRDLGR
jgi:hypothetical protein